MTSFHTVAFYAFAAALLASGLSVALARNPVHAAIFLVAAFLSMAGIWMLLLAEFLALALILVYVGAVMVLFLFVLMMLDINLDQLREGFWRGVPLALAALALLGVEMLAALNAFSPENNPATLSPAPPDPQNTRALGRAIYTEYAYPFQLAAVILLAAMVAAIALTLRRRKDVKRIDPAAQAAVSPAGRIRLVPMNITRPAETDDLPPTPTHPAQSDSDASASNTQPQGESKP